MSPAHRVPYLASVALGMLLLCAGGGCRKAQSPAPTDGRGNGGQAARPAVTFAQVKPILQRACALDCHDGHGTAADDFLFSDDGQLYQRLQGVVPPSAPRACHDRPLVVPGNAAGSLLMAMVGEAEGPRAECAERMPHRCPERRPCLASEEVETMRRWIELGAAR